MQFEFLIPSKKCLTVNPHGSLAICTLWTPSEFIEEKLKQAKVDISPKTSPMAIIGSLYGGGLKIMLRNLLYNPQIDTIAIFGKDMSESGIHLNSFFEHGEQSTGNFQEYVFEDGTVRELEQVKIIGNEVNYTMDNLVSLKMFKHKPRVITLSTSKINDIKPLVEFINAYKARSLEHHNELERIQVPLPEIIVGSFPSDIRSHSIVGDTIFDSWRQLLVKLKKFGVPVHFRGGKKRNELHNVKVVVNAPQKYTNEDLLAHNISPEMILKYQQELLNPLAPKDGEAYTYGNRLGNYFDDNKAILEHAIEDLAKEDDSRHSYLTLWDNKIDISAESSPCFVSAFFRKIDTELHLTATFRSHNGTNAWPKNVLGLLGILEHVCKKVNDKNILKSNIKPATISVISHSISIDTSDLSNVQSYIDDELEHSNTIKMDSHGYLQISISPKDLEGSSEIVVQHFNRDNEFLREYRGKKPQEIQNQLYRNYVISDIGHAMYIGGQLERACICLYNNIEYKQDKTILMKD